VVHFVIASIVETSSRTKDNEVVCATPTYETVGQWPKAGVTVHNSEDRGIAQPRTVQTNSPLPRTLFSPEGNSGIHFIILSINQLVLYQQSTHNSVRGPSGGLILRAAKHHKSFGHAPVRADPTVEKSLSRSEFYSLNADFPTTISQPILDEIQRN
jgi:hypothetical protein